MCVHILAKSLEGTVLEVLLSGGNNNNNNYSRISATPQKAEKINTCAG
jgi:hypothetical protein